MQHAKKIPLTFDRRDFEEIYFKDNNGSLLFGNTIKRDFITFIISLFFLFGSVLYSLQTNKGAGWTLFLSVIAVALFVRYIFKAFKISAWRKSISDFLDTNEKVLIHELIVTDRGISLVQDGKESIHKWETFTHAEITNDYLTLTGAVQYFIPKKSVQGEDFDFLIKEVRAHI